MNFLLNHAPLLREVCSLPFRKTLRHFGEQDLRHHCQRLAELVSVFPALKCIYHLLYFFSEISHTSLVWQKVNSVQALTAIKLSFLHLRDKEQSFMTGVIFNVRTE